MENLNAADITIKKAFDEFIKGGVVADYESKTEKEKELIRETFYAGSASMYVNVTVGVPTLPDR